MGYANAPTTYGPDHLWSYEFGTKSLVFQKTLSVNAAVYYIDWSAIQQSIFIPICGGQFNANVGDAKAFGAELEIRYKPPVIPGLVLSANLGGEHAYITSTIDVNTAAVGQDVLYTPKFTAALLADYGWPIAANLNGFIRGDYEYTGESYGSFQVGTSGYLDPGYSVVNLNAGVAFGRYEVALYAKNLFDDRTILQSPQINSVFQGYTLRPQTIGLTFQPSSSANTGVSTMRTIIRGARVLTMDPAGTELAQATVTIEDDTIVAVEAGGGRPAGRGDAAREVDAAGHLLMPGLVNGHFHSSVNHLKGALESLPLEIFMLFETPADGVRDDPRAAYVWTLLGAVEMLKSGVTTVLDDAFFVPAPSPAAIDAIMQAYADSGMRASLALDQPNVPEIDKLPFLKDLLPPDLLARASAAPPMDAKAVLDCYRHLIERWHGSEGGASARRRILLRAPARHAGAFSRSG